MTTRTIIRAKLRERADIESDTVRFPDADLNQYINDSLKKLQARLLKHSLLRDESTHEFTGDGSTNYALPSDYLATIAVFREQSGHVYRLRRHRGADQPFARLLDTGTDEPGWYRTARFNGVKSIELAPRPTSGTFLHTYVPVVTLDADTDELDDLLAWDEFIVLDSTVKCRVKDDIPWQDIEALAEKELARIIDDAETLSLNDGYVMTPYGTPWLEPADDVWHESNMPDYMRYGY